MNRISHFIFIAAMLFTASASLPASAAGGKALETAGLSLSGIETPAAAPASEDAPKVHQWTALRKITVNEAQPEDENLMIGMISHDQNIDKAVTELKGAGFKARPFQDNLGGYMVMVDVAGLNAADYAVGLSRYPYVTEVKVSRKLYNQLFGFDKGGHAKSARAYAFRTAKSAAAAGTIKGGVNHRPVDLTFDAGAITGGINYAPVQLTIDTQNGTVTGGANRSPVELKLTRSAEEVTVQGGANHSQVNYTVNWEKGLLEGYADNSTLRLEFDLNGTDGVVSINGYANNSPVTLQFNKESGEMSGGMGHSPVVLTFAGTDLREFFTYFFLFLK